jgi:hypothetical protein
MRGGPGRRGTAQVNSGACPLLVAAPSDSQRFKTDAFSYVLNNTGIRYASFYCVTAISAGVYYCRRVMSNWKDAVAIGILPSPQ